jgi:hypothetical protein
MSLLSAMYVDCHMQYCILGGLLHCLGGLAVVIVLWSGWCYGRLDVSPSSSHLLTPKREGSRSRCDGDVSDPRV